MKVAIIGLGLMGSSLALALRKKGLSHYIIGVENNPTHAQYALAHTIVNEISDLPTAVAAADIVVLATNMDVLGSQLVEVLNLIHPHTVVTDLGSTKDLLCKQVSHHPNRKNYVAGHPIAGTEYSGPENAKVDLYENKMMILCDVEESSPIALEKISGLFAALPMQIVQMNATDHDVHIAYVSHLSHLISFALSNTVLEKEKTDQNILTMAGSGFASTVRLAKSSPKMWVPIVKHNKKSVLQSLEAFQIELQKLKTIVSQEKWEELEEYLTNSNEIRKILN